jgi:hypothetical protein
LRRWSSKSQAIQPHTDCENGDREDNPMKCILILLLAVPVAMGQTGTASIAGTILDAQTLKPVPAALVLAVKSGAPPFARNTRSGGDGAFQVQGLVPGTYSLCVQSQGIEYLDPCQWNGNPTTVTLVSGQAAAVSLRVIAASVLNIQVTDAQQVLSRTTRDGRRPELSVGVFGPNGLYYPARASGSPAGPGSLQSGVVFQIGIPRDRALKLYVASRDLMLGDAGGAALAGNASQQTFQHSTGDLNPRSFAFTVLGLLE